MEKEEKMGELEGDGAREAVADGQRGGLVWSVVVPLIQSAAASAGEAPGRARPRSLLGLCFETRAPSTPPGPAGFFRCPPPRTSRPSHQAMSQLPWMRGLGGFVFSAPSSFVAN